MRFMLQLGIFDDDDVLPTFVVTTVDEGEVWPFEELRLAGEQEYGRKAPDHALFWSCEPEPTDG